MEGNFVKIDFEKAISSKKENLTAQLQAAYVREHIKNFIRLKKQEFLIKNKLKEDILSIKNKIKRINALFPKEKYSKQEKLSEKINEYAKSKNIIRKKYGIEDELLRIKRDLEILQNKR